MTEYGYNGLHMRVQTVPDPAAGIPDPLEPIRRQREYVPDFLSATCNVLAAYEGGKGMTRSVYGQGFHCLSQQAVSEPEGAGMTAGKAYFQPDIRGSELLAFDGQGTLQQYVERDVWGNRKAPVQGNAAQSSATQSSAREGGFCGTPRFAGYDYDTVIGKYFAQARFYDGGQGRMLALDPVKRGLNGYPYCNSDPVNYVDPTGEIAHVLGGAFAGAAIGGAFGFGGSVVSQLMSGERFNLRKAVGSGVNGAITGGFRGALIGSGAGAGLAFTSDFIGGAIGNAAEQWIVNGKVDPLESLGSGLVNGLSGKFYGTGEIRGLKDAVVRGARTGAGIGGLGYLLRWGNEGMKGMLSDAKNLGDLGRLITPQVSGRDPRGGCGRKSALTNGAGRPMTHGYRSDGTLRPSGSVQRKSQFSLLGFARETMVGGLMGGLSSAAFYGAGKAVERLKGSLRGAGRYGDSTDINPQSPMFGEEWHKYFNETYGKENVMWESASIQDIIDVPSKITDFSPEQIAGLAKANGWSVGPLGKGRLRGVPYEQGGGFSMRAPNGGSEYMQYHPGMGHHGELPYFKVSSGPNGKVRYYIGGNG